MAYHFNKVKVTNFNVTFKIVFPNVAKATAKLDAI